MDLSQLNDYSRSVAEALFAAWPHWRAYATHDPRDPACLMVVVPPPRDDGVGLVITTWGNEITIEFDRYHVHEDTFPEAKAFLDALLAEDIAIAVKMDGPVWKSAEVISGDKLSTHVMEEFTYVRSWRGSYDRMFRALAPPPAPPPRPDDLE